MLIGKRPTLLPLTLAFVALGLVSAEGVAAKCYAPGNPAPFFIVDDLVSPSRLVEGQFPDYRQVIPQGGDKIAKIARTGFAEALRRVSLLSQSRAYGVKLVLEEGKLELSAEDPELGHATESLEIEYKGDNLTVGFNARYIMDVLALINDEGIQFALSDDLSPAVIRPLEEEGFLAVVMPMRI